MRGVSDPKGHIQTNHWSSIELWFDPTPLHRRLLFTQGNGSCPSLSLLVIDGQRLGLEEELSPHSLDEGTFQISVSTWKHPENTGYQKMRLD